jgi:hypothetical protein
MASTGFLNMATKHQLSAAASDPHFSIEEEVGAEVAAWTEIEAGRFMPRRVRGSYLGRALG